MLNPFSQEINYVVNSHVQKYILKFQKTRDQKDFEVVLEAVDKLLLSSCIKLKKRWAYLATIPLDDLYQSSVIALYDVANKYKETTNRQMIPAMIIAYTRALIRKQYSYLMIPTDELTPFSGVTQPNVKSGIEFAYDTMVQSGIVIQKEHRMIKSVILENRSINDTAKTEGVSPSTVIARIHRGFRHIREHMGLPYKLFSTITTIRGGNKGEIKLAKEAVNKKRQGSGHSVKRTRSRIRKSQSGKV